MLARVENSSKVMDLRATFLKLAIAAEKLRVTLFEDCDDISNTALMKIVLDVREKVDEVTDDIVNAKEVKEQVKKLLSTDEAVVLAIANYNLGLINRKYPDREMFLLNDEEYFIRCKLLLKDNKAEPKVIITMMKTLEQLHEIWWHAEAAYQSNNNKYLNKILELYIEYVEQDTRKPIDLAVELGIEKSRCSNSDLTEIEVIFLRFFASSMDLYAQNKHSAFVVCLHRILQHQLPNMEIFDVKAAWEWISTLCEISIYFMKYERFAEAKNYIATAEYVLTNYHDRVLNGGEQWSDADRTYLLARFDFMRCVISRFWGIYGIELLTLSKKHLVSFAVTDNKIDLEPLLFAKKPMSPLLFTNIENSMKDAVRNMRTQVLHSRDAKEVILTINNNFLTATKTCFSATNNIIIYTNITIELSKAYKFLAFFEKENEKKIKWCARRIKILTDLFNKNSQICTNNFNVLGKISLHVALAKYSFLDTAFDNNVIRKIVNTKSYYLTDYITLITEIEKHLQNFEMFAQNIFNK